MNNDLISREALKKACSEMVRGSNNSDFIPCPSWNNAMELIDNVPTVEVGYLTNCANCERVEKIRAKRPHGKWIFRQGTTCGGYYKCSECGEVERAEKNFCPNCGADNRRGIEDSSDMV